jgi:hypothetical protein
MFSTGFSFELGELRMSILSSNKLRPLSLGFPTLDDVFPGFEPGDFTVLQGNVASSMIFTLSVRAQLPRENGGLDSSTVFVDGGNSFSPYEVAENARDYGLDCKAALERVYVSRAFTAYQLSSLILEKLRSVLRKTRARLLVVSDVASLFLDRDIPKTEGRELFMKVCSKLSEIASEKRVIVVASYFPERQSRQGMFFEAVLFGKADVLVKLRRKGQVLTVALEDHPSIRPFSMDFTADQPVTRVFGGVCFGEDRSVL